MAGLDSAVLNPCTLVKQDLVSANQVRSFELGINVCVLADSTCVLTFAKKSYAAEGPTLYSTVRGAVQQFF